MHKKLLVLLAASTFLSACAVHGGAEIDLSSEFLEATDAEGNVFPEMDWWRSFNSRGLLDILARAEANNPNLMIAAARIARAETEVTRNSASLYPSLSLDTGASRVSRPYADPPMDKGGSSWQAGLRASYELDLWGANSAAVEAAQHRLEASRFDRKAVAVSLFAEVANAYTSLLTLQRQKEAITQSLEIARQVARLTAVRVDHGITSGLENAHQRSVIAGLEARLGDMERQITAQEIALAVLLGEYPPLRLEGQESLMELEVPMPEIRLIGALVYQRPDVMAMEARLAAADADIEVAKAALMPSLSFSASGNYNSDAIRNLFDPAHLVMNVTASLVQSVFDGGARSAAVKLSEIEKMSMLEEYRSTLLRGLEEALVAYNEMSSRKGIENHRLKALSASREALSVAEAQYRVGTLDYLNLLEAQRSHIDAEIQAILARQARIGAAIGLYRAVGGGFGLNAGAV